MDAPPASSLAAMEESLPFNETLQYARALLQDAVMVEHSTIPLYLTALYSIMDCLPHSENCSASAYAVKTIHSVVLEEMLHMTIAANVLNAVGGEPLIDSPHFIPTFPLDLPLTNVSVDIRSLDKANVRNFMLIESTTNMAKSIGAAYEYVLSLLQALSREYGEQAVFAGNFSRQVEVKVMNQTAPKVATLHQAVTALLGVSDQGGGCPVPGKEQFWPNISNISAGPLGGHLSHFARFYEIAAGRRFRSNDTTDSGPTGDPVVTDWLNVYTFVPNPKVSDFAVGTKAHKLTHTFASKYTSLLVMLHKVFNGAPDTFGSTVGAMMSLVKMAVTLFNTPDPRAPAHGLGIGPTWEYIASASEYAVRNNKAGTDHEMSRIGCKDCL